MSKRLCFISSQTDEKKKYKSVYNGLKFDRVFALNIFLQICLKIHLYHFIILTYKLFAITLLSIHFDYFF